jgi:hypothetical protein
MKTHLVNCTYCDQRLVTAGNKKRSIPELERCGLTMGTIKKPNEAGRFCEHFHQIGHDCESCL